jgi:hypothetical protein
MLSKNQSGTHVIVQEILRILTINAFKLLSRSGTPEPTTPKTLIPFPREEEEKEDSYIREEKRRIKGSPHRLPSPRSTSLIME